MKHLFGFITSFLILFNIYFYAQNNNLPKTVTDYINKKNLIAKKYGGNEINGARQILKGDLNNDGKEDIVLKINILYGTQKWDTLKQYLSIFLFKEKDYKLSAEKEFQPLDNVAGNFAGIDLKELKDKEIIVIAHWWGKDDPNCCPSISKDIEFWLSNNSLLSNKNIDEVLIPKINDELEVGNFKFCVNKIEFKKELKSLYNAKRADGIYLLIYLTVKNITKETRTLSNSMFQVIDADKYEYEPSVDAINILALKEQETVFILKDIPPKIPKEIIIPFEVPTETVYVLKLSGGFWSNKSAYILLTK